MDFIYKSASFSSYCRGDSFSKWRLYINFETGSLNMRLCEFLLFKYKIDNINIDAHFDESCYHTGLEVISVHHDGQSVNVVITTKGILELRNLLAQTLKIISQNSLETQTQELI